MDESSFLDDPELLSELAELGTFDDEPAKLPQGSLADQTEAAPAAGDASATPDDESLKHEPGENSDDEEDDPSLRADLAALMTDSGHSEEADASPPVTSAAEASSSAARTSAANKAAAARKEAGAARATALGITQEAATALKLESFALNKAGDKAGAAAKFRAYKAMEKELAAAAAGAGRATSASSGVFLAPKDCPKWQLQQLHTRLRLLRRHQLHPRVKPLKMRCKRRPSQRWRR